MTKSGILLWEKSNGTRVKTTWEVSGNEPFNNEDFNYWLDNALHDAECFLTDGDCSAASLSCGAVLIVTHNTISV